MVARRRFWLVSLSLAAACSSSSPTPNAQPAPAAPHAPQAKAAPAEPGPADRAAGRGAGAAPAPALPQPDFLRLIPADTPFLFAALSPLPAGYAAREYVSRLAAYEKVLPAVERLRRERPRELRRLDFLVRLEIAVLAELGGTASAARLAAIGLDPATVGALYGLGMNPVVRIRLSDPARFAAALDRMAARLQPIERAALGKQRYYAARDETVLWIVAVAGRDLVVALIPPAQRSLWLPLILGQRAPARSLAGDRRLDQLAADYGLSPAGLGYAQVSGMAAALGASLPSPCREELVQLAGAVPRIAVGLTSASAAQMRARSAVELRPDIAVSLTGLRGEVPGLAPPGGAPAALQVAAGVDVNALVTWLKRSLARVAARPFRCPSLAWINDLARTQAATLRQAAGALASVRGASLSVRDIEGLATGSADIFILFGSDQPGDVLKRLTRALGVTAPRLSPGDPPVELASALGGAFGRVHVALAPRALGLSLGAESDELAGVLALAPVADPPLLQLRIDPQAIAPILGLAGGGDPRIAALDPELARNLAEIEQRDVERYDEVSLTVRATPRGLDIELDGRYAAPTDD
jgi:hypothetical protein